MYPYVALGGPTYRENSHANHTWRKYSHQTACFKGSEAPPPWVRFPSPAPFSVVWRRPVLPQHATSRIAQFPQPRYGRNRSLDRMLRSASRSEVVIDRLVGPSSTPCCRRRPTASEQSNRELSQNEHWRRCTIEESIPCDTIMPVL